jgi:methyl-accepting chemotaxis protein
MNWHEEVKTWIKTIQKELEGLNALSEKLLSDKLTPAQILSRFQNVVLVLKEGMLNLIDKSNSLLKFETDPGNKLNHIRSEYQKAMKSLNALLKAVNESTQPHYKAPTYVSRKRSLSKKDLSPRVSKPSLSRRSCTPIKEKQLDHKSLHSVKSGLKKIKSQIENHTHQAYEEKIKKLEEENKEIKKIIQQLRHETKDNFEAIPELKSRIDAIEKKMNAGNDSGHSKKQRFLLKSPSASSETSFKDFEKISEFN